jgi:hypothetical protein
VTKGPVLLESLSDRCELPIDGIDIVKFTKILNTSISIDGSLHPTPMIAKTINDGGHFTDDIDALGLCSQARYQIQPLSSLRTTLDSPEKRIKGNTSGINGIFGKIPFDRE